VFLSDPGLRPVAAPTGGVWPEHLRSHDTAATEPIGDPTSSPLTNSPNRRRTP
jgi:hypothetical protein